MGVPGEGGTFMRTDFRRSIAEPVIEGAAGVTYSSLATSLGFSGAAATGSAGAATGASEAFPACLILAARPSVFSTTLYLLWPGPAVLSDATDEPSSLSSSAFPLVATACEVLALLGRSLSELSSSTADSYTESASVMVAGVEGRSARGCCA